jgi:hypothetical protein
VSALPELIMRHAYFDETGVGDPTKEPNCIVAGIMLEVDRQYESLRKYLLDMAADLVGKNRPRDFTFHAKELWHGTKRFPRAEWPIERRMEVLAHLADIPARFDFPIFYAVVDRAKYPPKADTKREKSEAVRRQHGIAFAAGLQQVELWMREMHPDERVFVVSEDHADHRSFLGRVGTLLSDPRLKTVIENDPNIDWEPLTHLVDEPHFSPKSGSSPLQVADTIAYILGKHFVGDQRSAPLLERFRDKLAGGLRTEFVRQKTHAARSPT